MKDPIKIIHKFKNNNRKTQYNILIFVGNLINESTNRVLKKIKDKNLYDTLTELNDNDIEIMNKEYGNKWYKYFFIDKHINHTFDKIIKPNESKKKDIIKKYGQDWYNQHIEQYVNISKTIYSYQTMFKQDKEQKQKGKKIKDLDDRDDNKYTTDEKQFIENKHVDGITPSNSNKLLGITDKQFVKQVTKRINLEDSVFKMLNNSNNNHSGQNQKINLQNKTFKGKNDENKDNNVDENYKLIFRDSFRRI